MLLAIAHNAKTNKRYAALFILVAADQGLSDPALLRTFRELLTSDDPEIATAAVRALDRADRYPPEVIDVLMAGPPAVQKKARQLIYEHGDLAAVTEIGEKVLAALYKLHSANASASEVL